MTATVTLDIQCPITLRAAGHSDGQPVSGHWSVDRALRLALAFDAEISTYCRWTRLARSEAELSNGHRVTYLLSSLARGGWVSAVTRRWPIVQVHLAEDHGEEGRGAPRIEIFVAPIRDEAAPKQVAACLYALRALVYTQRIASPNELRCAAHVAVEADSASCTIVDVDTCADPSRAIAAELHRQSKLLSRGARVSPDIVRYDDREERALVLGARQPAASHVPTDPGLPPLHVDATWIARIRSEQLPPLHRSDLRSRRSAS